MASKVTDDQFFAMVERDWECTLSDEDRDMLRGTFLYARWNAHLAIEQFKHDLVAGQPKWFRSLMNIIFRVLPSA